MLIEERSTLTKTCQLNFSKCRVSLAVPKNSFIKSVKDFEGKKIATSYPNTVNDFFKKNNVNAEVHTISGSVEIAPTIGLADGICDIVSSGNTLFMNGLVELETILRSEAVLVQAPQLRGEKMELLDEAIPNVLKILPGMKSPTVLPLAEKGWSSLHSVISEDQFWDKIDALKEAGAEGILVVPIEKMVR